MMSRFVKAVLFAAALCTVVPAFARFPSRTVFIVDPFPPGGVTDLLARALASQLTKLWHQSVVVENVPGAGSIIGAAKVAHAAPDGQTLLLTIDATVVSSRFLHKHLPYDPDKGLEPITMLARSRMVVVANPSFPPNNMREAVALARREPDRIAYGSSGVGTPPNLMFATIGKHEGVKFLHVPYKGVAKYMVAVMSDQVPMALAALTAASRFAKAGKVKALAVSGSKRARVFPNVPTLAESGYGYVNPMIWWGLFAPGGTSAKLVARINRDVTGILKRPDFTKKYFVAHSLDRIADTPSAFEAAIRHDVKVTAGMVKAAGLHPQ